MSSPKKEKTAKKGVKGYSQKEIEIRIVKNFLDIIILVEMRKQTNLSGYDIIAFVNSKFGGMLSPGTVYATLYGMERKGLIMGENDGRKTVYKLTAHGEKLTAQMMEDFNQEMTAFVRKFLMM